MSTTNEVINLTETLKEKNKNISLLIGLTKQLESIIMEEDVETLQLVLAQRETLMKQTDEILGRLADASFPAEQASEVESLKEQGRSLFGELFELDKAVMVKANELMSDYQAQIRLLKSEIKSESAYMQYGSISDGIYFDKKR